MTSARLSTEALEPCLRRVICKEMQVGKATCVNRARRLFVLPKKAKSGILSMALVSQQERSYKKLDSQEISMPLVYVTDNRYEAGEIVYITENRYEATELVCFTDNRYEASKIVFITDNRYEATSLVYVPPDRNEALR